MIYFMQAVDGGPIKIGFTDDVHARHRQLERHYGVHLEILATIDGDQDEESEIHERFSHLRLPGVGRRGRLTEQFSPSSDLMEFMGRPALSSVSCEIQEAMLPVKTAIAIKAGRDDATVKINRTLVSQARHIAHFRGVSVAEILSELLRSPLAKAYGDMLKEIDRRSKKE